MGLLSVGGEIPEEVDAGLVESGYTHCLRFCSNMKAGGAGIWFDTQSLPSLLLGHRAWGKKNPSEKRTG